MRPSKETNTVKVHIYGDHEVCSERTRFADWQVLHDAAVYQQSAFTVFDRGVKKRYAATGANREGQIALVTKHEQFSLSQIRGHRRKRNFQIFKAGDRQMRAQKRFHARIRLQP